MSERAAIVPAGATSNALGQIIGTGSVRAGLQRVEENVRDVIDVCRQRGFVQRFGGDREFFGLPAWQMLGATYGLLPFVEWSRPLDGGQGWEARAVVRTVEGVDVGAAEAMCTHDEPNRRRSSDHDLRAMAQTRAMRNALRAVLGSALVLAGFDFADPDAPATRDQTKALWTIAGRLGWSRDEAHERAGVVSLLNLTREQASELVGQWGELLEREGEPAGTTRVTAGEAGEAEVRWGSGRGRAGAAGRGRGEVREGTSAAPELTLSDTPWARYNTAVQMHGRPELQPALLRRAIRAANLEYPPRPDWPAEVLTSCAAILEGAAQPTG